MSVPSQHLTVQIPQVHIERLLRGGKETIHPNPFAWAAWGLVVEGPLDVILRASAHRGGDLLVDPLAGEKGVFLVAEVFLPRVTFTGWIDAGEITPFWPVKPCQLRPVRQLLANTAAGWLMKSSLRPTTAVGFLARKVVER